MGGKGGDRAGEEELGGRRIIIGRVRRIDWKTDRRRRGDGLYVILDSFEVVCGAI
jgi:hypothetical protein